MALLKFLLVAYLIYITLKFVLVRVVPVLLVRKIQKLQEEAINKQRGGQETYRHRAAEQGHAYGQAQTQSQQEGNVTITVDPEKHSSNIPLDEGEYIDYEEVK